jgi:hypothetical protein
MRTEFWPGKLLKGTKRDRSLTFLLVLGKWEWNMHRTGPELCPVADFGINCSAIKVLVY